MKSYFSSGIYFSILEAIVTGGLCFIAYHNSLLGSGFTTTQGSLFGVVSIVVAATSL